MLQQRWFLSIAIGCLVLFCSCDPGASYVPVNGELIADNTWAIRAEDFVVVLMEPSFLSGSSEITPEPTIQNVSDQQVRLETVTLLADGHAHVGQLGDGDYLFLDPGESVRVPLWFSFDDKLTNALGRVVEIRVHYTMGAQPKTFTIALKRS